MAPGQYGYRHNQHSINLPPLMLPSRSITTDHSQPLSQPQGRHISAAPVLPNLRSILESVQLGGSLSTRAVGSLASASMPSLPKPPALKFIINKGITLYQGDHVAVLGEDSHVYFAVLLDFWMTEHGRRFCTLRWLLPKPNYSTSSESSSLLPATAPNLDSLQLGPIHGRVESMEVILDVFYSPYRMGHQTTEQIKLKYLDSDNSTNHQREGDEMAAKMLLSMS